MKKIDGSALGIHSVKTVDGTTRFGPDLGFKVDDDECLRILKIFKSSHLYSFSLKKTFF